MAPKMAVHYLAQLGEVAPVTDPVAALELLAGEAMAAVEVMRGKVAALTSVRYETEHGEQIRGEVEVWLKLVERAESINSKIVALGLYERRLALEESKARAVAEAVRAILEAHGIKGQDIKAPVVRKHLAAIDGTCEEINVLKKEEVG